MSALVIAHSASCELGGEKEKIGPRDIFNSKIHG